VLALSELGCELVAFRLGFSWPFCQRPPTAQGPVVDRHLAEAGICALETSCFEQPSRKGSSGGQCVLQLLHGGARGARSLVDRAARLAGWPVVALSAEWVVPPAAGPIRNRKMLKRRWMAAAARGGNVSGCSVFRGPHPRLLRLCRVALRRSGKSGAGGGGFALSRPAQPAEKSRVFALRCQGVDPGKGKERASICVVGEACGATAWPEGSQRKPPLLGPRLSGRRARSAAPDVRGIGLQAATAPGSWPAAAPRRR